MAWAAPARAEVLEARTAESRAAAAAAAAAAAVAAAAAAAAGAAARLAPEEAKPAAFEARQLPQMRQRAKTRLGWSRREAYGRGPVC